MRNVGHEMLTFNVLASSEPITYPLVRGGTTLEGAPPEFAYPNGLQDNNFLIKALAPGSQKHLAGPTAKFPAGATVYVKADHLRSIPVQGSPVQGLD